MLVRVDVAAPVDDRLHVIAHTIGVSVTIAMQNV